MARFFHLEPFSYFLILYYQVQASSIKQSRKQFQDDLHKQDIELCCRLYQEHLRLCGKNDMPKKINGYKSNHFNEPVSLAEFTEQRNQRIEKCYQYIRNKRVNHLHDLVKNTSDLEADLSNQNGDCNLTDKINNNAINNTVDHKGMPIPLQCHTNGHAKAH